MSTTIIEKAQGLAEQAGRWLDERRGLRQALRAALTVGLMIGAGLLLSHALRGLDWRKTMQDCWAMPWRWLGPAILSAGVSYAALCFYDYIACRWIGCPVAFRRVAGAAFLAYAFSHTLGFPAVTGGAVRYRLYAAWGVRAADVARIMALAGVTLVIGLLSVSGATLAFGRQSVESHLLGGAMLAAVALYVVLGAWRRSTRIGGWTVAPPKPGISLAQILAGSMDWTANAGVLYLLLPTGADPGFFNFLGLFVTAYLIATFSNVPAGLGIFESIILADLHGAVPAESLVSALLVYRAVYFLLPFTLAGLALGAAEAKALTRRAASGPADGGNRARQWVKTS